MKGINLVIAMLMTMGIALKTSQAIEEKRSNMFELAESGQTIELPMRPKEFAFEEVENAKLDGIIKARINRSKIFEMGETGQVVEFPMSPEEVANDEETNVWLVTRRNSGITNPQSARSSSELAESGIEIKFSMNPPKMFAEKR